MLGKISETQHLEYEDRFANTTASGGYTVPSFQRISEVYGIKAVTLKSYEDLGKYKEWIEDREPCLFDIPLPEDSFLTPKIKFETSTIMPKLDDEVIQQVINILSR